MRKYVADFETCTWDSEETYVWAWSMCEIGKDEEVKIGKSIQSFFEFIRGNDKLIYFHNLKFDAEFIISYLFKLGFKHIEDINKKESKTFTTLINEMGQFYMVEVYFFVKGNYCRKVTFYDSLKLIPYPVEDIPKSFGLDLKKLDLDYDKPREKGYTLTKEEEDYVKNDVRIVAQALQIMFNNGFTKMTTASNSLNVFKNMIGERKFNSYFPKLPYDLDRDLRLAYKGGFTYLNDIYKEKTIENITILDVNSLYPSVMVNDNCPMPYDEGRLFEGKYEYDENYPLYIQEIWVNFEIKKNKIPTIQIKKDINFIPNEYIKSSNNEIVHLYLTNVDLELFKAHYNIYEIEYGKGVKFKSSTSIFKDYIEMVIDGKNKATKEGNLGQRIIYKILANSLYGKFATSQKFITKIPYYGKDELVHYRFSEEQIKDGLYLPIACFITSYARRITIETAQKITDYSLEKYGEDYFIYSDTDSIHTRLGVSELRQFCEIDDIKLGAWKQENVNPFNNEYSALKGKFIRQKTYLEEIYKKNKVTGDYEKEIKITCAGMPKSCYKYVEWEKFKEGFTCGGKLRVERLKGGIRLIPTDFTIKSKKIKNNLQDF